MAGGGRTRGREVVGGKTSVVPGRLHVVPWRSCCAWVLITLDWVVSRTEDFPLHIFSSDSFSDKDCERPVSTLVPLLVGTEETGMYLQRHNTEIR